MRPNHHNRPSYIEIDLGVIAQNTRNIKEKLPPGVALQAVVKADGYGHGAVEVARVMAENGADCFGVAFVEEGIQLREAGIHLPIIVLYPEPPNRAHLFTQYHLIPTISDLQFAKQLDEITADNEKIDIFIKVDTGMSRYGPDPDEAIILANEIRTLRHLKLAGVSTNFSSSDNGDPAFSLEQLSRFTAVGRKLREIIPHKLIMSIANSGGLLNLEDSYFDMVRVGLLLYGYYPSKESKRIVEVKPALKLTSRILFIRELNAGQPVGYGMSFVAAHDMRIATIPIGYGDGYPRALSNRGEVLIGGRRAPIIGRVCMDALMVDITSHTNAGVGDEVVLIGQQGGEFIGADEIAELCGTIPWEITCGLGPRLPATYIHKHVEKKAIGVK